VNQLAKELADAIGAAVADNASIEACRAKARDAGFDLRVSIEAVVGFVNRTSGAAVTRVTTPARLLPASASTSSRRTTGVSCARCASAATIVARKPSSSRVRSLTGVLKK
jgi:hypothetical protein